MNTGIVNKIKHWVSGDPFDEELYLTEDEYEAEPRPYTHSQSAASAPAPEAKKPKSTLKVVDHPNSQTQQVMVIEPRAFEESLEIVDQLRARKSVILNLHLLDTAQSQRVVDFLSGATHAIDGHQQRIGDGVFIFTPSNVVITSEAEKAGAFTDAFWNTGR